MRQPPRGEDLDEAATPQPTGGQSSWRGDADTEEHTSPLQEWIGRRRMAEHAAALIQLGNGAPHTATMDHGGLSARSILAALVKSRRVSGRDAQPPDGVELSAGSRITAHRRLAGDGAWRGLSRAHADRTLPLPSRSACTTRSVPEFHHGTLTVLTSTTVDPITERRRRHFHRGACGGCDASPRRNPRNFCG